MRKTIIQIISMCAALFFMTACDENNEYLFGAKEPLVEILPEGENEVIYTPEAQSGYGLIRSNARWKVISLSDWLTCSTASGEFNDTIRFEMQANAGDVRMGQIVILNTVGQQKSDTLTVTQQCAVRFIPAGYFIKLKSEALGVPLIGEEFIEIKFEVNSSTPWRAFTKRTDPWSTMLTKKGSSDATGTLAVSKNESLEKRAMYFYVQSVNYPTLKDSIEIHQLGRPANLAISSPSNKKVILDGGESRFSFSVKGDGKWEIVNTESWLTLDKTEYEGDANVFVAASSTSTARSTRLMIRSLLQPDKTDFLTIDQQIIPSGRLKDSLALVAIYQATGGERWNYSWKFELSLSEGNWPGVFFDEINGELRVIDLSLASSNLEGSLPNEIGWLTEVVKIKVQSNKLSGALPASLNRLTNLTHFYLNMNQFSGEFPDLSALQKLTWVEMNFNRFEGEFPESFLSLPKLNTLKMQYNNFDPNTCVPARFGGWKLNSYINPQRRIYGDKSTDYNLKECPK